MSLDLITEIFINILFWLMVFVWVYFVVFWVLKSCIPKTISRSTSYGEFDEIIVYDFGTVLGIVLSMLTIIGLIHFFADGGWILWTSI